MKRLSLGLLIGIGITTSAWAGCDGSGMMGATQENPIVSTVDLSFSPTYSVSSTSGTSGCKNWDFARYLEEERERYLASNKRDLLENIAQGAGPHLQAFSQLAGCVLPEPALNQLTRQHQASLEAAIHTSSATAWTQWVGWTKASFPNASYCANASS